ncbi:putative ABC transport system permease protein [Allocatelliglobosispora scoriae]|uniref:Putative ABC transport system permease protein n=1 Tax=Allocatelliglobosispora scoriae TaxID=643052 RepID=A0A841BGU5_9ACTN|nr:FtsX-like permease family protein [Allocatelliglobosispora scoriae]MBB5867504.1 putative ABC transport system permease protein [Allocatelliglobosispora scoriae]
MGRLLLIVRLARRDLRRRPIEAIMALLVIAVATTTLTIGLALTGVTDNPYQQTRVVTSGPDVVANIMPLDGSTLEPATVDDLVHAPGVVDHSGPFPLVYTDITANGHTLEVEAIGREEAPASIDQPKLTQGGWVHDGEVVLDRGFADTLGAHVGDEVTVGGRPFRIAGTAVTAALPAYPSNLCHLACMSPSFVPGRAADIGLVWLTAADLSALTTPTTPVTYLVNLRLADPDAAEAFVDARRQGLTVPLFTWQDVRGEDNGVVQIAQAALQVGGVLLALLAIAGMTVLAGRRMTEQTRRVGLLKAIGATPELIAAALLAEHLVLALIAAAAGLGLGWLLTPLFTSTGAGLVGAPGAPAVTISTITIVAGVAFAVALAATIGPALRAVRRSTVAALADPARLPRRRAWLNALSAQLPVPLLLGLRILARRPRRALLNTLSTAVTVTGLVTILVSWHVNGLGSAGLGNLRTVRLTQVTTTITVMLVVLATVNTVFMAWATVSDARHSSALARAFGATPAHISSGLSVAQLLPAFVGAAAGLPVGVLLYRAATQVPELVVPPLWQLIAVLVGTLLAVSALTALPARLAARRPVSEILRSEPA